MYQDANGNIFESYEAACHYYGADTPEMIEQEQQLIFEEEANAITDAMEARGGPIVGLFVPMDRWAELTEEVPF